MARRSAAAIRQSADLFRNDREIEGPPNTCQQGRRLGPGKGRILHAKNGNDAIRKRPSRYRAQFSLTAQNVEFKEVATHGLTRAFVLQKCRHLLINMAQRIWLE